MTPAQARTSPSSSTFCEVTIVGRMGGSIVERELPSGDVIVAFTIVVDRPLQRRPAGSTVRIDAVPCQVLSAALRAKVGRIREGALVEASGVLRRRFWRHPGGLGSALEVEVSRIVALA